MYYFALTFQDFFCFQSSLTCGRPSYIVGERCGYACASGNGATQSCAKGRHGLKSSKGLTGEWFVGFPQLAYLFFFFLKGSKRVFNYFSYGTFRKHTHPSIPTEKKEEGGSFIPKKEADMSPSVNRLQRVLRCQGEECGALCQGGKCAMSCQGPKCAYELGVPKRRRSQEAGIVVAMLCFLVFWLRTLYLKLDG